MREPLRCCACSTQLTPPQIGIATKLLCPSCGTCQVVQSDPGGTWVILAASMGARPAATRPAVAAKSPPPPSSVSCESCGAMLRPGEGFCTACGASIPEHLAEQLKGLGDRRERARHQRELRWEHERKRKINRSRWWILAMAILFAVIGTGFGLWTYSQTREARQHLEQFSDEMNWPNLIEGREYTVGELKQQIDLEVRLVFATHYLLAVLFLGLFFWSRRSPFSAMVSALCTYWVIIVLGAIIEPATLASGWLIKILFTGAMLAGIKQVLTDRRLTEVAAARARKRRA